MSNCRVVIDVGRCAGIGMCEGALPDLFEVDDDGHARVLAEEIPAERFDELLDVAANCPPQSVSVELAD